MSFLQPLLLLALPLALAPIIIHLLNRLRFKSVKWGAMMFVLKANRSSTNMARIRQWLILASRVLAILAIIFFLSRPLLGGWLGWKFSGEPDTVILLLDRSATMGGSFSPKQNRLEKAIELIIDSGLKTASTSRVVLIDSALLQVNEIPSWNVISQIKETKITQTTADIPAMYRIALDYMVNNVTGVTEVWTLSDMQHSNWDPENSEWSEMDINFSSLPQPVTFRTLAIDSGTQENRSISFAKLSEYPGKEGNTIREISFEIISSSKTPAAELPLQLMENGTQRQLTVKISGQTTKIRHTLESDETKTIYGSITLPPDANPNDNSFFFGFGPKSPEQAIIVFDNEKAGSLLSAASAPEGEQRGQRSETISASSFPDADIESASIIICQAEPDKEMLKGLRLFAKKGGNVIFFPPSISGSSPDSIWSGQQTFEKDKEVIVADWDRHQGPLANTVSGEQLNVDGLKLKKRTLLQNSTSMPIASCSDGKPFLYGEKTGKGMIYYCTTLPVAEWSNLGDGMVIVPMLRRLMQSGSQRLSNIIFDECGKWQPNPGATRCDVLFSDKKEASESDPLCNSGIYAEEDNTIILNRPNTEDAYNKIDETVVKTLFENNPIRLFKERSGSMSKMQAEIWRVFLFAVLCALGLESILCLPINRNRKKK